MLHEGGWPIVVDEATLIEANELGRVHTDIRVDHTGTAGLAGLLASLRASPGAFRGERIVALFTGEDRRSESDA